VTPEVNSKIAIWRAKAAANTLTLEDMREAIVVLRGSRVGAAHASDASRRKKAKAEIPSAEDMLSELGLG